MATSLTRGSALIGRFVSGVLGQTLISTALLDYYQLNFLSFASVLTAFTIAVFLPPSLAKLDRREESSLSDPSSSSCFQGTMTSVASSLPYFTASEEGPSDIAGLQRSLDSDLTSYEYSFYSFGSEQYAEEHGNDAQPTTPRAAASTEPPQDLPTIPEASPPPSPPAPVDRSSSHNSSGSTMTARHRVYRIWFAFKESYSNKALLKWSAWWAVATCGNFQVGNYVQNLWEHITPSAGNPQIGIYNGAVDAASTLCGRRSNSTRLHIEEIPSCFQVPSSPSSSSDRG
jgi:thiamine transporter 2/3